jgi:GNAT superfamily N-acetyltransferase
MNISVVPMDATRREDFYRVHSERHGCGWCNCVAWWVPTWEGWGQRTADQNRALREDLFGRGQYDGYLLYADGQPVGWCQCGPRDRLPKLVQQFRLQPDPKVWAITCLLISPTIRKKGLAAHLLEEVLQDLRAKGVPRVQAFPRRGQNLPDEDVWTGPEALYRQAGFVLERDNPEKPIYCKQL